MSKTKLAKILMVLFIGFVVIMAIATSRQPYAPSNILGEETVSCITAVCVSDTTLGNCIEFLPRVASVTYTSDVSSGAVRLVVSLNNKCTGK